MKSPNLLSPLSARAVAATVLVGLIVVAGALLAVRPLENLSRDLLVTAASPFAVEPGDIVLVTINEQTLAQFPYRSPIDRGFLAGLVAKLDAAGPRAIGVDLLFDQATEPEKDAALAGALENAKAPVVIAAADGEDGLTERQQQFLSGFAPKISRGLVALNKDRLDGVVRSRFAGTSRNGEWQPAFADALAAAGAGIAETRQTDAGAMVYYRTAEASPFAFPAYPAQAAALLPAAWFAGKFVLIGVDLPVEDRHATPFGLLNGTQAGALPGLAVHAHGLAQILRGDRIREPAWPVSALLALAIAGLCAWASFRPGPVVVKPLIAIAAVVVWWAGAAIVFANWAVLAPVAAPSLLIAAAGAAAAFLGWRRDSAERRFLESAFAKYVSPEVVRDIVADPSHLRLGGEKRQVTCVFTDLEGFTSLSEKLQPEQLAALLNSYLDAMCNLFVEHGATIDKVIGDAVVGFFGAPSPQDHQAARAVGLALAIDELSQRFRKEQKKRGVKLGVTRVGVHGGPAIVGNFGGERFFDYTAIGDTVNTAARLEGANKYLGTRICVSEAVAKSAPQIFRPSGILTLKGKSGGIATFEPLKNGAPEQIYLEAYRKAYARLAAGGRDAKGLFARLAAEHPQDRLVAFHCARLASGQTGAQIVLEGK